MHGEVAGTGFNQGTAVAPAIDAAQAALRLDGVALGRDRLRDAMIEGVDHTANGLRAIAQRGRPAHDLNLPQRARIDRNGVIIGERRDIAGRRPFSLMPTRKPLKPRMMGRLAPGAKDVAARPGLVASASPSWT